MKYRIAVTFILLSMAACKIPSETPQKLSTNQIVDDSILIRRIIGTWQSDKLQGTDLTRLKKTFDGDFTAHAQFGVVTKSLDGAERFFVVGTSVSRWKVENGYLITYDHHTVPSEVVSPDVVYKDRIISVDDSTFVFWDTEGNYEDRSVRVRSESK